MIELVGDPSRPTAGRQPIQEDGYVRQGDKGDINSTHYDRVTALRWVGDSTERRWFVEDPELALSVEPRRRAGEG